MVSILIMSSGMWLVIILDAILNGTLREKLLMPMAGLSIALPLGGTSLAAFVFFLSLTCVPFIASSEIKTYVIISLF